VRISAPIRFFKELMARLGHSSMRAAMIYQHATYLVIVTTDPGRSPATPDGKSGISGTGEPAADMIGILCVV
jgi:hypothetical protein